MGKPQLQNCGLEDLDIIALIDVHESLIGAVIQQKESSQYMFYETHIP